MPGSVDHEAQHLELDRDAARAAAAMTDLPVDHLRQPLAFEPDIGEGEFLAVKEALDAVHSNDVRAPHCDSGKIVEAAQALVAQIEKPDAKPLFALLPAELMGDATPERLSALAQALFYLETRARSWSATRPPRRVDEALVKQGIQVRNRMLRVLAYHEAGDSRMMKEIKSIKAGTGYTDLASDLSRVATHYSSHRALLDRERVQYDPADEDLARGIAHEILTALSKIEDRSVPELRNRAFTLIVKVYARLKQAADFIFADHPARLADFPALRKAAVPNVGRPKGSKKRAADITGEPSAGGVPNAPEIETPREPS
jgi:hypothetical protein